MTVLQDLGSADDKCLLILCWNLAHLPTHHVPVLAGQWVSIVKDTDLAQSSSATALPKDSATRVCLSQGHSSPRTFLVRHVTWI